jgi:hypothetical protein
MAIRTELSFRLGNSPGALARVCDLLSRERVSLLALHLEGSGRLRLVVDNPLHAAALLRQHHTVEERDVLFVSVPNQPGGGVSALRLLAEADINIEYAYASAVEGSPMATIVVGVADAQRASALAGS